MSPSSQARLTVVRDQHSEGRVALEYLAQDAAFWFAGFPERLRTLPVVTRTTWDEQRTLDLPYGPPGAWATPFVDYAIFEALTRREHVSPRVHLYARTVGTDAEGKPWFRASADVIGYAARPETIGWVHVVEARRFTTYNRLEGYARRGVRPLLTVRVTGDDCPRGIYLQPTVPTRGREHLARPEA